MKKLIIILLLLPLVYGCKLVERSPQRKLERAKELILEAEARGAKWQRDTVWRDRYVKTPGVKVDTSKTIYADTSKTITSPCPDGVSTFDGLFGFGVDSVMVEKKTLKAKAKLTRQGNKQVLTLEAEQKEDSVKVKERTTINNTLEAPPCPEQLFKWWHLLIVFLAGAILGVLAGKFL